MYGHTFAFNTISIFWAGSGGFWWVLEPMLIALTYSLVVALFFHLEGLRFWTILISLTAWRWFSNSIDMSPHLLKGFIPYLKTGDVSLQLLFVSFLAKATFGFLIALSVIVIPTFVFAATPTWNVL